MTATLLVLAMMASIAAVARSTYSPCGLSMLSSITPFGERARGHRYYVTAGWFVLGAGVGGAVLGGATAGLAALVSAVGPQPRVVAAVGAVVAVVAAALDGGLGLGPRLGLGEVLPVIRRQVDDGWMAKYRPWLYGAGFGWQIGVGFATYVMTAALPLLVVLAALTGSVPAALAIGTLFGVGRGLTVFLTATARTPARLRALHSWLDRIGPAVRWAAVGVECSIVVVLAVAASGSVVSPWLAAGFVGAGAAAGSLSGRRHVPARA